MTTIDFKNHNIRGKATCWMNLENYKIKKEENWI